ncbi:TetR family transcriptional regulator [Krasilnikovia cinnamomea]|uniref:TetR family transcriptional regulator n=1 Tax=Krasilnikovia cinnamomea TaxID=349313 RepID=A0A4Q7ZEQ7_9ACTN|nr:TetR/AcrR family transcriptional regulator [Krasilnikovia cinnamomea]RZU49187.1 TetR family transcriptional regulator [Krasilnikovia cinnamomea]
MTSPAGLRERKKAATRAALSHAAWSLMITAGLSSVTPEAIAAAADVSPRTFRNYFASREEAILGELLQRHLALLDKLRGRPADEALWDGLEQILPQGVTEIVGDRDSFAVLAEEIRRNPAMLAQNLVVFQDAAIQMAAIFAERTATDLDADPGPRLLAAAVCAAISTSIDLWISGAIDRTLPELIRDCLARLRAGLPMGAAEPAA